jgi:hypothetical protein
MKLAYIIPVAGLLMLTAACASPSANTAQLAQERHSCAEMGIAPGSQGAYSQCVASLDATMFETNDVAAR